MLCFIIFYRRFLLSNVLPNLYLFENKTNKTKPQKNIIFLGKANQLTGRFLGWIEVNRKNSSNCYFISYTLLGQWTMAWQGRGSSLPLPFHPHFLSMIVRREHDLVKACFSGALQYFENMKGGVTVRCLPFLLTTTRFFPNTVARQRRKVVRSAHGCETGLLTKKKKKERKGRLNCKNSYLAKSPLRRLIISCGITVLLVAYCTMNEKFSILHEAKLSAVLKITSSLYS